MCWVQRWVAHCKGQCAGAADADAGRAEGLGQGRCQGSDGQTLVGHAVGEVAQTADLAGTVGVGRCAWASAYRRRGRGGDVYRDGTGGRRGCAGANLCARDCDAAAQCHRRDRAAGTGVGDVRRAGHTQARWQGVGEADGLCWVQRWVAHCKGQCAGAADADAGRAEGLGQGRCQGSDGQTLVGHAVGEVAQTADLAGTVGVGRCAWASAYRRRGRGGDVYRDGTGGRRGCAGANLCARDCDAAAQCHRRDRAAGTGVGDVRRAGHTQARWQGVGEADGLCWVQRWVAHCKGQCAGAADADAGRAEGLGQGRCQGSDGQTLVGHAVGEVAQTADLAGTVGVGRCAWASAYRRRGRGGDVYRDGTGGRRGCAGANLCARDCDAAAQCHRRDRAAGTGVGDVRRAGHTQARWQGVGEADGLCWVQRWVAHCKGQCAGAADADAGRAEGLGQGRCQGSDGQTLVGHAVGEVAQTADLAGTVGVGRCAWASAYRRRGRGGDVYRDGTGGRRGCAGANLCARDCDAAAQCHRRDRAAGTGVGDVRRAGHTQARWQGVGEADGLCWVQRWVAHCKGQCAGAADADAGRAEGLGQGRCQGSDGQTLVGHAVGEVAQTADLAGTVGVGRCAWASAYRRRGRGGDVYRDGTGGRRGCAGANLCARDCDAAAQCHRRDRAAGTGVGDVRRAGHTQARWQGVGEADGLCWVQRWVAHCKGQCAGAADADAGRAEGLGQGRCQGSDGQTLVGHAVGEVAQTADLAGTVGVGRCAWASAYRRRGRGGDVYRDGTGGRRGCAGANLCARDCDAAAQCHRRDRAAGTGVGDVRRAGHTQARWQGVGEADGLCWVQRWVAHCKGQCAGAADADAGRAEGLGQGRCQGSDGQTLVGHAVGEVAQTADLAGTVGVGRCAWASANRRRERGGDVYRDGTGGRRGCAGANLCARDCDAAAQCHRRDRAAGTGVGDVRRAGHTQARWQGVGEADGLCWVQRWVAHCKGQCAGAADADAGRAEGLGQGRCQGSDGQTLVGHAVGEVAQTADLAGTVGVGRCAWASAYRRRGRGGDVYRDGTGGRRGCAGANLCARDCDAAAQCHRRDRAAGTGVGDVRRAGHTQARWQGVGEADGLCWVQRWVAHCKGQCAGAADADAGRAEGLGQGRCQGSDGQTLVGHAVGEVAQTADLAGTVGVGRCAWASANRRRGRGGDVYRDGTGGRRGCAGANLCARDCDAAAQCHRRDRAAGTGVGDVRRAGHTQARWQGVGEADGLC